MYWPNPAAATAPKLPVAASRWAAGCGPTKAGNTPAHPSGLIIDSILRHLYTSPQAIPAQPAYDGLPGNLRQFFGTSEQPATA